MSFGPFTIQSIYRDILKKGWNIMILEIVEGEYYFVTYERRLGLDFWPPHIKVSCLHDALLREQAHLYKLGEQDE